MIEIQQLHKSFRMNHVLKGIDLILDKANITAVLGPNGSGKTTLIKCILGLVLPDKGRILFENEAIHQKFAYRNRLTYLSQIARFPENLTVQELLQMIKDIRRGKTREGIFIDTFGLGPELGKKMHTLSGGTRQKVNLMLSLMYDTPLIILDEPSNGLDPFALMNLKQFLMEEKKRGKYILMTTHIMSLVEDLADNVVFLLEGHIYYQGSIHNLIEKQDATNLENAIAKILKPHVENI